MKKYLLIALMSIFAVSCSKKVEFSGNVKGGSPLDRVEFIEASGVGTLPLINVGVDKNGNFKGSFDAPKNGMYVISYAGQENLIYLKQGQKLQISGEAGAFPMEFKIEGDAKNNNDFLTAVQKFMMTYTQGLNMQEKMGKDEKAFVADMKKIQADLDKSIKDNAEKFKADKEVVEWKTNDIKTGILSILPQYAMMKKQASGNPNFKSSKEFTDYENSLQADKDALVKEHPAYRQYLLTKINEDFQKFAEKEAKGKTDVSTGDLFNNFLKTQKDFSQTAKDYLLAFVITQSDMRNPNVSQENMKKMGEIVDKDIKDAQVKKDLKDLQSVLFGLKKGEAAPEAKLETVDGKPFKLADLKGKPSTLIFYSSWTPYIQEAAMPMLKQAMDFYGKNMNFVAVDFDDTKEQFAKTSTALFKGTIAKQLYADGGLSGDFAKKYGIYGFKLQPSYLVLDKDGKIAGRPFFNLGDPEMTQLLDQLTGLKFQQPEATLQNDLLVPQEGKNPPPAEAPKQDTAKTTK